MLPKINPATTAAWKNLETHAGEMKQMHLRELFVNDTNRYEKFALCTKDIVFDYSKNIIAALLNHFWVDTSQRKTDQYYILR